MVYLFCRDIAKSWDLPQEGGGAKKISLLEVNPLAPARSCARARSKFPFPFLDFTFED
jgi:hypothetical protein